MYLNNYGVICVYIYNVLMHMIKHFYIFNDYQYIAFHAFVTNRFKDKNIF